MPSGSLNPILRGVNDAYINSSLRSGVSQQILFFEGDVNKVIKNLADLESSLNLIVGMIDKYARDLSRIVKTSGKKPEKLPPTLPEKREEFAHSIGNIVKAERKKFFQTNVDEYLYTIQALAIEFERPFEYDVVKISGEKMHLRKNERGQASIYNLQQEIVLLNDLRVFIVRTLDALSQIKNEIKANADWVQEIVTKTGEFKPVMKKGFFSRLFGKKGAN